MQMPISGDRAFLVVEQQKSLNVRAIELLLTTPPVFLWLIKHCTGLIKAFLDNEKNRIK